MDEGLAAITRRPGVLRAAIVPLDAGSDTFESACRRAWTLAEQRAARSLSAAQVRTPRGTLLLVRGPAGDLRAALTSPAAVASVIRYELGRLDA